MFHKISLSTKHLFVLSILSLKLNYLKGRYDHFDSSSSISDYFNIFPNFSFNLCYTYLVLMVGFILSGNSPRSMSLLSGLNSKAPET